MPGMVVWLSLMFLVISNFGNGQNESQWNKVGVGTEIRQKLGILPCNSTNIPVGRIDCLVFATTNSAILAGYNGSHCLHCYMVDSNSPPMTAQQITGELFFNKGRYWNPVVFKGIVGG